MTDLPHNKKPVKPVKPTIGGQAVLEGVMMRAPERVAVAVRKSDGTIAVNVKPDTPLAKKHGWLGWPVIRGCVNLVQMLRIGMQTITVSAELIGSLEDEEPTRLEQWLAAKLGRKPEDVTMGVAIVLALALAIGLFVVIPSLFATFIRGVVSSSLAINIIEGVFRLLLFAGYLVAISLLKEIKRTFQYHGAEHKVVYCYENDKELTVENARGFSSLHPRCGTSFLLIVMLMSILVFTLFGWNLNAFTRIISRLALLPVVAGLSYELLRVLSRHENAFVRALRWPGMQLQRMTTRNPDDSMIEVAIAAFKSAVDGVVPENAVSVEIGVTGSVERAEESPSDACANDDRSADTVHEDTVSSDADHTDAARSNAAPVNAAPAQSDIPPAIPDGDAPAADA